MNSGRKRYCKLTKEFANTALSDGKKELIDQLEMIFRTECVGRRVETAKQRRSQLCDQNLLYSSIKVLVSDFALAGGAI
jgi:hypothetical protein